MRRVLTPDAARRQGGIRRGLRPSGVGGGHGGDRRGLPACGARSLAVLLGLMAVLALSAPANPGLAQAQSQAQVQTQAPAAGGEAGAQPGVQVIRVTAEKFEFKPDKIVLAKGRPVVLELASLDRLHGFRCPGLGIRVDVEPGKLARVPLTPDKVGSFPFVCDVFCGEGHDEMTGVIVVTE